MLKQVLITIWLVAIGVGLFSFGRSTIFGCNLKFDLKHLRSDGWFGETETQSLPNAEAAKVRPFTVNISNDTLQDLKNRLANARYVDHIEDTQFTYGFNSKHLKEVVEYWRTKYNWRIEEAKLNSFPQFVTQIEGLDIHFIRVKPSKPAKTVLPLLVVHGWPGSVLEYYKSFPLLTEPDQNGLAFEVIAPSIPGFGFSEAPHQKGFDLAASARVFVKLMKRLGHDRFVAHGGDAGYAICRTIALIYPERTIGAHLIGNLSGKPASVRHLVELLFASLMPRVYFGGANKAESLRQYSKAFPLGEKLSYLLQESGYFHLQATKPDTIGAALVDSPVGLAAWILEKFSTWTDKDNRHKENGGLSEKFSLDELLTNVMIYWTSGNIASSKRFYKETVPTLVDFLSTKIVDVPVGSIDTPHELSRTPRKLIESYYDHLLQYTELTRGGHFTAFEEPELVVEDLRLFVGKASEFHESKRRQQEEELLKRSQKKSKKSEM